MKMIKWFVCLVVSLVLLTGCATKNETSWFASSNQCAPDISLLEYSDLYGDKLYSGVYRGSRSHCITMLVDLDDLFSRIHEINKYDIVGAGINRGLNFKHLSQGTLGFISYNPQKENCLIGRTSSKSIDLTLCKINSEEIKVTLFDPADRKFKKYSVWRYRKT